MHTVELQTVHATCFGAETQGYYLDSETCMGLFKAYMQFVNQLCAFVGECEWR